MVINILRKSQVRVHAQSLHSLALVKNDTVLFQRLLVFVFILSIL